ncbi:hypothetical protein GCM10018772_56660 [Streptomyces fumanus]|uniref:Uncharacterized protein n=1 Tax=Streptomyces fumanus TaxID=67302 RepID=A0A919E699_9ACTN|nr:hypothetical protein GCM10018772_56660 [Streptomyces fumanus]
MRTLLDEIEGHLLVAAARAEGRSAARRFTAPFDWLTEWQRKEIEDRFEAGYLALSRTSWQRTAERAGQLRAEYEERYRTLRRRLLAGFLLTCATAVAVLALLPEY